MGIDPTEKSITNDLNQLVSPAGFPVGISHIAARDLQAPARSLKTPVGVDLFLDLREGRNGNRIRILR